MLGRSALRLLFYGQKVSAAHAKMTHPSERQRNFLIYTQQRAVWSVKQN